MTKEQVLAILRRDGGFVSGESISHDIGVSRMAVNAAVRALREDGFRIEAVTNKGYRLASSPDRLDRAGLGAYLPQERMERVICKETVDSTNTRLRALAVSESLPAGTVMLADTQTGGRGRLGRTFHSPGGVGVYLSYLLRPDADVREVGSYTSWAAVAASRAVSAVTGLHPGIKWVNDLVFDGKKVAGILTEMSLESETGRVEHAVIGIGVNVNTPATEFDGELYARATSLAQVGGRPYSRAMLAAELIRELDKVFLTDVPDPAVLLSEYRARDAVTGREISVPVGGTFRPAVALGINDDYSLRVRFSDGTEQNIAAGEVSVKGIYGE